MAGSFNPRAAYESGLVGARHDPRADEEFADSILRAGGQPDGGVVAHQWEWAGIGKDKLTATWLHVEKQFPGCWPGPAQQVGDCFVAGTMVTMSDGTRKPIESVREGDFVVSPAGSTRRVMSVFSKSYTGDLLTVSFESRLDRIECTPDHRFLSPVNEHESQWVPASDMVGRHGLVPFAEPEQPRQIQFDLYDYGFSSDPNETATGLKSPARRLVRPIADAVGVSDQPKVPRVSLGFAPKVSCVSSRPWSGTVYCIEVDEDHAFIANGVAVHNCVSHGCKNASLTTLACELASGEPDEVTGKIEGKPDVSAKGIKEGVLSTEAIYWWRYERMGPRSMDGWTCPDAAKHVTTNSGLWLRKDYPEFGFNLTEYSAGNIRKYLGRNPPDNVRDFGRQHLIRTATKVSGFEQARDFLAAGYGVFFCSGVGWESSRNEDGVSSPRGSWAHSQSLVGADDRPETIRKYGEPLICILNSWNKWNRGPRKVMGTTFEIPHGAYWTKASIMSRMSCIALSSVAGWPRRKLPSYGAGGNL